MNEMTQPTGGLSEGPEPAPKGKRFGVAIIDLIVVPVLLGIVSGLVLMKVPDSLRNVLLVVINMIWLVFRDLVYSPGRQMIGLKLVNLTGEKVSESQVVEAVRHALDAHHHRVGFFTLTPVWGETPYYQLLLEARDTPPPQLGEQLASTIDAKLQELNCEYQEKRLTGRLASLRLARLTDGSWRRFAEQRQARLGGSIEQYKHPCLMPDPEAVARAFGDQLRG